jgi:hypothetical protein
MGSSCFSFRWTPEKDSAPFGLIFISTAGPQLVKRRRAIHKKPRPRIFKELHCDREINPHGSIRKKYKINKDGLYKA